MAFDLNGDATVTDADSVDFDDGALTLSRTSSLAGDFSLDTSIRARRPRVQMA
ncbi:MULTISPECIES: hypothetical protein [Thiorhodovibrio]|uniref:hypothetical protein n=1 Tax=Thiorhodovibrio TaxID=61593 RepID=UPI001913431A|nr:MULTISPECIES: hypothetical protein [Thiorhodovibrio]